MFRKSRPPAPAVPSLLAAAALLALTAGAGLAQPAALDELPGTADYERLLEWRFSASPTPLPAGGAGFERGPASWRLDSGSVRLMEPIAGGAVTGALFEGSGRFRVEVDDPVERRQLRRFASPDDGGALIASFSRLIVRLPGGAEGLLGLPAPTAPFAPDGLAAERHEHWLEHLWTDVDARVVAALRTPGSDFLWAAFETDEHGWLVYEVEPTRAEEVHLYHWEDLVAETWLSFDRTGERGAGRGERPDALEIGHVDIRADLTEAGRGPRRGITETHPRRAKLTAELRARSLRSGPRALLLTLRADAEVTGVRVDGREQPFLRHHIGGRRLAIGSEYYDDSLVVLLDEPLAEGAEMTLAVDYEVELYNYAVGRSWYPDDVGGTLADLHTGTIELTLPDKIEARSMGRREEGEDEGRGHVERWVVDEPTFMLSFTYAERAAEYELDVPGAPHIEVFGPGMGKEAKFHNVAADVANSVRFYTELFDMPLETEAITVSSIVDGHGQAFEGFIHMGEGSFYLERPGASELFRAHEVAHQWWGHRVSWQSYRDQWLSEAFAEYSAMMYVQATMEDGERWFGEILDAYHAGLTGSIKMMLSKFSRTGVAPLNENQRARMGPIALGHRAVTSEARGAYFAQAYMKGAMVLHMLRVMLRNLTKSDELFVRVLSEFLAEHDGRSASTEDFARTLARVAPGDWSWFFDQWVYGTAIPTYSWSHEVTRSPGGEEPYLLRLTVRQSNVPRGFRMPVPVALDFGRQGEAQAVVLVHDDEETFEIPLPAEPEDVQLNPDHAVLAQMNRL